MEPSLHKFSFVSAIIEWPWIVAGRSPSRFYSLRSVRKVHDSQSTADAIHKRSILGTRGAIRKQEFIAQHRMEENLKIEFYHSACHLAAINAPFHASGPSDSNLRCSAFHRHIGNRRFSRHPFALQRYTETKWFIIQPSLVIIKYSTHQPSITRHRKLRNERDSNFRELTLKAQNVAPERLNLFGFASSNWIMLRLGKLSISLDDDLLPSLCRVAAGSLEAPNANSSWKSSKSFGSET